MEMKKMEVNLSVFFIFIFKVFILKNFAEVGCALPLVPLATKGYPSFRWKYCVWIYTGMQSGMFV